VREIVPLEALATLAPLFSMTMRQNGGNELSGASRGTKCMIARRTIARDGRSCRSAALPTIKLIHTLAWFSIESCVAYVLWAGFTRRSDRRAAIAAGVVAGQPARTKPATEPSTGPSGVGCRLQPAGVWTDSC
jgi:hypothetical protein